MRGSAERHLDEVGGRKNKKKVASHAEISPYRFRFRRTTGFPVRFPRPTTALITMLKARLFLGMCRKSMQYRRGSMVAVMLGVRVAAGP